MIFYPNLHDNELYYKGPTLYPKGPTLYPYPIIKEIPLRNNIVCFH